MVHQLLSVKELSNLIKVKKTLFMPGLVKKEFHI